MSQEKKNCALEDSSGLKSSKEEKEKQSIFVQVVKLERIRKRRFQKFFGAGASHRWKTSSKGWKCGVASSLVVLLLSISAAGVSWSGYLENCVISMVTLYEGGFAYNLWRAPPVPTFISIYPFNYTNLEQMYEGTEVPHVQELGPYIFREKMTKTGVTIFENNTLRYRENRTHEFVPRQSSGTLSDKVTVPNLAMIAGYTREKSHAFERFLLQGLSIVGQPFLKVSVEEFVWGYGDLLADLLTTFSGEAKKFGVLSNRFGLSRDEVEISTGGGGSDFGVIRRFAGHERIGAYESICDEITGTDGSLFPREKITHNSTLYVYAKDLCRRLPMVFQEQIQTEDDLPAYRFVLPDDVFDHNSKDNFCFCSGESCPPRGIFNTARCNFGVPVVVSFPHFTHADDALLHRVTGLKPNPDLYKTVVDVSKVGITLAGVSKLQIGLLLRDPSTLPAPLNRCVTKDTVLPIAWLELKMDRLPERIKSLFYHFSYTAEVFYIILKVTSLILICVSLLALWRLLTCTEENTSEDENKSKKNENVH